MAFEGLSEKLQNVFKGLQGKRKPDGGRHQRSHA